MSDTKTGVEGQDWLTEVYSLVNDDAVIDATSDEAQKVGLLFGMPMLAQELYAKGLIFLINQAVLHNYGYAIGCYLSEPDDDGVRHVTGLSLHRSMDPDGIWFDEDTIKAGRGKLRHVNDGLTPDLLREMAETFNKALELRTERRLEAAASEIRLVLDARYGGPVVEHARRLAEVALRAADGVH